MGEISKRNFVMTKGGKESEKRKEVSRKLKAYQ